MIDPNLPAQASTSRTMELNNPKTGSPLPPDLVLRIDAARATLAELYSTSLGEWLDSVQQHPDPESEILWWERIARCYVAFTANEILTPKQKKLVLISSLAC